MGTRKETVDYLLEQMSGAGMLTARKMFGEYAIYCEGKIVALVCDDQLFIKPTAAARAFLGADVE
ncbi:MAG: competence protein TfoX, partial [Leptolinea sp.]|nr:competence protein TfoX [Leptolinea sp.]